MLLFCGSALCFKGHLVVVCWTTPLPPYPHFPSSISSPESEELTAPDLEQAKGDVPTQESNRGSRVPVSVNSHLLTRASALQLADSAVSDANFSEEQLRNRKLVLCSLFLLIPFPPPFPIMFCF